MIAKSIAFAAALALLGSPAYAFNAPSLPNSQAGVGVIHVANGCGHGRYRGPYGSCHRFGHGPGPSWAGGPAWRGRAGCPWGFHRGTWGHCRHN
jgi:hypothetical protein